MFSCRINSIDRVLLILTLVIRFLWWLPSLISVKLTYYYEVMFAKFMTASKIAFSQINKCIIGTHNDTSFIYQSYLVTIFDIILFFSVFNCFICITGDCLLLSQVQLFIECGLALIIAHIFILSIVLLKHIILTLQTTI